MEDSDEWMRGVVAAEAGSWEDAATAFRRAPRQGRVIYNAAVCYSRMSDSLSEVRVDILRRVGRQRVNEALTRKEVALNEALAVDPYLAIAHARLARLYAASGSWERAVDAARAALRSLRNAPHIDYAALGLRPSARLYAADLFYAVAHAVSHIESGRGAVLSALMDAQRVSVLPRHHAQLCAALCVPARTSFSGGALQPVIVGDGLFVQRERRAIAMVVGGLSHAGALPDSHAESAAIVPTMARGAQGGVNTEGEQGMAPHSMRSLSTIGSTASSIGSAEDARVVVKLRPRVPSAGAYTRLVMLSRTESTSLASIAAAASAKLCSAGVRLSYVDADGDVVALLDDEDVACAQRDSPRPHVLSLCYDPL